jgi:hypothetical protein
MMTVKHLGGCILATLFGFVVLCGAQAQDTKPIDGGKAEEFKGKTFDIKEKGEAAIMLTFPAGKKASITLRGEKKTDVHLFVYDADKKVIAKDDSPGPDCDVNFTPKKDAKYTLVIRNLGPGANSVPLKVEVAK